MSVSMDAETVLQGVRTLYHNPDAGAKEQASAWLQHFQNSVSAWEVCDQLLRSQTEVEVIYFAAQTMRTKIQYSFLELPQESYMSLRDSLLEQVIRLNTTSTPQAITQLCLGIADLALQMPQWSNAAVELIQRFGNNVDMILPLMEVLTYLAEELTNRALKLGANRRHQVTDELLQCSELVVQFLAACCQNFSSDERVLKKVFNCLNGWFSVNAMPSDTITDSKLLTVPFQTLVNVDINSNLHEAATDCICSALYACEDLQRYMTLMSSMVPAIDQLVPSYQLSVTNEDIDKSINYSRIFTEFAESLLPALVYTPGQGLGSLTILDILLECVRHCQYEVAEITFNFWYRLSETIFKTKNEPLITQFTPYFEKLIEALSVHCRMDPDHEGVLDATDEFAEFRMRVCDLIKECVYVVGSTKVLNQMNAVVSQDASTWDTQEAGLYVMFAVAQYVNETENVTAPGIVSKILSLPETVHVQVKYTSIQLIGQLGHWLKHNVNYIDAILKYLISTLQHSQLSTVASASLQDICTACSQQMGQHFDTILQISAAVDSVNVSNETAINLLISAAVILARMPADKISEGMKQLVSLQAGPLVTILSHQPGSKESQSSDPVNWLDRLAAIFRHTVPDVGSSDTHPCKPAFEDVWPVLSSLCERYQAEVRIVEHCCRCIRFAVRCTGRYSSIMLQPIVQQILSVYPAYPHSCFLYLGSILVDEYGTEPACVPTLINMLQSMSSTAFKQLDGENGLRDHPDTVDDLFRLCTRLVQRCPIPFLSSSSFPTVIQCALAATYLEHREANASVMKFLKDMIRCSGSSENNGNLRGTQQQKQALVQSMMAQQGQVIIDRLLNAILFHIPTYLVADVTDVIYEMKIFNHQEFSSLLKTCLHNLPRQSSSGAINATDEQLTFFHDSVINAPDDRTLLYAVRDFTRLFK